MKNLNRYRIGGTSARPLLGVPLPRTPEGRVYRFSPNEAAYPRHFVLGDAIDIDIADEARRRMKQEPRSPRTVCPYSGVIAEDEAFAHPDDREAALKTIKHAALEDAKAELHRMLSGVARKSRGAITYKPARTARKPKPRFARDDLMRELVCDHCGRDYGVYAIALFCPDCGAPNLRLHFSREAELVDAQVELAESLSEDRRELAYRLLGNAHEDVLTAFETTLKTVYQHGLHQQGVDSSGLKPVGNDFQNIERGRNRFAELGLDPFDGFEPEALEVLKLNVQKRHIIGHNLGVVDAKFAEHARDARVGETIDIIGDDIRVFAGLCQAVVDRLDAWLAGGIESPTASQPLAIGAPAPPTASIPALAHLNLSPTAIEIGRWLSRNDPNGLTGLADVKGLKEAFQHIEKRTLEDALAELAAEGIIETTALINSELPRVSTTLDLFATFDPVTIGDDPARDAGALAELALEMGDSISCKELHEKSGWTIRRFNPALGILLSEIDERRVSQTHDETYAARHFFLVADDRVALRRFAAQVGGGDC